MRPLGVEDVESDARKSETVGRNDANRAVYSLSEDGTEEDLGPGKGALGNLVADHNTSQLSRMQLERSELQ
jgi:hypothetical protein